MSPRGSPAAALGARVLATAAAALLLAGCSVVPEPAPPVAEYHLDVDAGPFRRAATGPVLVVAMPEAAGGYAGTAMRYRKDGPRLYRYATGTWVEPPAAMLGEAATAALGASGRFAAVVPASDAVPGRLRLSLHLRRLVHDLSAGGDGVVRMEVRMTLVGRDGGVLAADVLEGSAAADSAGPAGMAGAARSALDIVLDTLVKRVVGALGPRRDEDMD